MAEVKYSATTGKRLKEGQTTTQDGRTYTAGDTWGGSSGGSSSSSGGNGLTQAQIAQGYSTIPGAYDPLTGKLKTGATENPLSREGMEKSPLITGPTEPMVETPTDNLGIVDTLNKAGQASDFNSRSKMAGTYGIQGYTGTADQNNQLKQKWQNAQQLALGSGNPPPTTGAGGVVTDPFVTEPPEDLSYIDDIVAQDPYMSQLLATQQEFNDVMNQKTSLVDEYKAMVKEAGIDEINTDLINTKNIIDGTEDDIRNEVTKAGGFATDSQVLALSNARNKTLIKNYNTLLETKQAAMENVNMMMGLMEKDRANALTRVTAKMNLNFQIADYVQKAQTNAQNTLFKMGETMGWDAVYKSALATGDPYAIDRINKVAGAGFDIATMATQPNLERQLLQEQIKTQQATRSKIYSDIEKDKSPQVVSPYQGERTTRILQAVSNVRGLVTDKVTGRNADVYENMPNWMKWSIPRDYVDFRSELENLKVNVFTGELTAMREASKTGGAVGNVSDREGDRLANALAALNTNQSKESILKNLTQAEDAVARYYSALAGLDLQPAPDGSGDLIEIID